jgi:hypothetical protein
VCADEVLNAVERAQDVLLFPLHVSFLKKVN